MQNIDRRSLVKAAGAAAFAGMMPVAALAEEISEAEQDGQTVKRLTDDMQAHCDRGGTSLMLEELNRIRHERVDAAGDFVREDGTVVPAVWNKLN